MSEEQKAAEVAEAVEAIFVPVAPTELPFLSAAEILAQRDVEVRVVPVPEWNTRIRLQTLTALESAEFTTMISDPKLKGEAMVYILYMSAVGEDGRRIFRKEDLPALKKKAMKIFIRLQDEAMDLNGLTEKAKAAAKNASGEAA